MIYTIKESSKLSTDERARLLIYKNNKNINKRKEENESYLKRYPIDSGYKVLPYPCNGRIGIVNYNNAPDIDKRNKRHRDSERSMSTARRIFYNRYDNEDPNYISFYKDDERALSRAADAIARHNRRHPDRKLEQTIFESIRFI